MSSPAAHPRAVAQALLVTFLWATSWVIVKIGLRDLPALTFAGLRYSLAWLCLLPLALQPPGRAALRSLTRQNWLQLLALGVVFYALTQGAQFVALSFLPAITVNLLLNFSVVLVALLGFVFLAERPSPRQWLGLLLALAGALLFFNAPHIAGPWAGYGAAAVALSANALSAILGRRLNRQRHLPPLTITTVSMGLGGLLLLLAGVALQGLPALHPAQWASILWLAVVNTAFAFTLWNHTLRTLTAVESSVINNLLIVQIPLLAWLFLDERLTPAQLAGLILAGGGSLLVSLRPHPAPSEP